MDLTKLFVDIRKARAALQRFEDYATCLGDPCHDGANVDDLFSAYEGLDQALIEIQADLHPLEGRCNAR